MHHVNPHLEQLIDLAFTEDVAAGDVTAQACVPEETTAIARVIAKEDFIVAGNLPFKRVFDRFGDDITLESHIADGQWAKKGDVLITVKGNAQALLIGERPALNFLMRLSGIATGAKEMSDLLSDYPHCKVVDTRKTTPGWRWLEKQAVKAGGAGSHRFALYDGILIKENHIACAGGIANAVSRARAENHHLLKIEVETTNLDEVEQALEAEADVIMLDNMNNQLTAKAVQIIKNHPKNRDQKVIIEASGNMTGARLEAVAELGVNIISMGALTHSSRSVDVSMKIALDSVQ